MDAEFSSKIQRQSLIVRLELVVRQVNYEEGWPWQCSPLIKGSTEFYFPPLLIWFPEIPTQQHDQADCTHPRARRNQPFHSR